MLDKTQVYVDELFFDMRRAIRTSDTIRFYPYRKARPNHILIKLLRQRDFELQLASKAEIATQSEEDRRRFALRKPEDRIDNHTLYQITMKDGSEFCVWCHDSLMYIGLGINEGSW